MFEFDLPFRVQPKRIAWHDFALRLQGQHFAGVIEDRRGRVALGARPPRIAQRTERRRFLADADIARDEVSLLERNVEFGAVGEFERENFLVAASRRRYPHQLKESSNAMLKMNDVIAFSQFAEIDLRAVALGASQASSGVCGKSAEQFCGGKNDQVRGGEKKSGGG